MPPFPSTISYDHWQSNKLLTCAKYCSIMHLHACQYRRSCRRQGAGFILARKATQEPDAPVSFWSKTVKGTLKRWTTSERDSESKSNATRKGSSTQNGSSQRSRQKLGSGTVNQRVSQGSKRGRTVKQTSGETRGQAKSSRKGGRFYWNITGFPFPLGPLLTRRTIRYEVCPSHRLNKASLNLLAPYIHLPRRFPCSNATPSTGITML